MIPSLPLFLDTKSMDWKSIRGASGAVGQRQYWKWNGAIKIRSISGTESGNTIVILNESI